MKRLVAIILVAFFASGFRVMMDEDTKLRVNSLLTQGYSLYDRGDIDNGSFGDAYRKPYYWAPFVYY